jgi:hypothetical protein
MKIIKLNCAACGAPISIPENVNQLNCANCGTHLYLEHGEGYYALKAADQISSAIHESGRGTQDAIREGAQVTTKELKRLQLTQSLGNASNALNATMAEQRALTRGQMTPQAIRQLHALNFQEWGQYEEVRHLQLQMDLLDGGPLEENELALKTQINMLDHSIMVMKTCPPSTENQKILQTLMQEKTLYQGHLREIGAKKLRSQFKSFTIRKPFSRDLNLLIKQLKHIEMDKSRLAQGPQTPVTTGLQTELADLYNSLYQHWEDQVRRQCWQGLDPNADPGSDLQKTAHHLKATRSHIQWLESAPNPSRSIKKEIRQLRRREGKLSKTHQSMAEQIRFRDALKLLRTSLSAFAITQPFSSNLLEVRGQMKNFQQDLNHLQQRSPSPEVRQAQQELNDRYQALYQHWAVLERQNLENQLSSQDIRPPFSSDFSQARADYDKLAADASFLKENPGSPGASELYQDVTNRQRLLYDHLLALKAAQQPAPPDETPES